MNKKKILSYLGYDNQVIDDDMKHRIKRAEALMENLEGRYIYQRFDFKRSDAIEVLGTTLRLPGKSIQHILSQSDELLLFCGTLGWEADQMILKASYQSMVDQMIMDACASVKMDMVLDHMQENIELYQTPRFSPGYGDLPLTIQSSMIEVLGARRIGVQVTSSSMLIPKKSVTGIIGLSRQPMTVTYRFCDDCLKRTSCDFKICNRE